MSLLKYLSFSLGALALSVDAACTRRGNNSSSNGLVASTYFAGFHATKGYPVSSMQWDKYTDVKYAFAETSADGTLNLSKSHAELIPDFVAAAKKNGVKAQISIGGWTGSRWFSTAFGSAANRTAFVKQCMDLVNKYNLDGIDIDWEYPNRQGLGCNAINVNDTANFLLFLQELRQQPNGKNLYLTAAGSLFPWYNSSGVSSTDLGGLANVLDYVMIMNYDIYGAWAATGGPNAPLNMTCSTQNNQGAAVQGVAKWTAAGFPAKKVVLGVPAYGHGFSVNTTSAFQSKDVLSAFPPQNSSHRFQGGKWDDDPAVDECGNANPPGGTYTFANLITDAGFLNTSGDPLPGIRYGYDECSQTPAIYNETAQIWVSYDNTRSFTAKGNFIKDAGLAGFCMYEAGGDYNNILVNSIRSVLGLK